MAGIVFLCSGQGSQYAGMGRELYDEHACVREIYECAGDILGFDLAKVSFDGEAEQLSQTRFAQPAIFAVSLAAHAVMRDYCEPAAFAGHSLGEYAALTAAGAFKLEDGFRLVAARAAAMERAVAERPGSMYAIVGSDEQTVCKACSEAGGYVQPVNFNSPSQTVIAGESEAAARAAELLSALGAKSVKLAVGGAFHTDMMSSAARELRDFMKNLPAKAAVKPFYSNLTGKLLAPDTLLSEYLPQQMLSPVRFHEEMQTMVADGMDVFVELGPGKVLSSLIRRSFPQVVVGNVENPRTLERTRKAVGCE